MREETIDTNDMYLRGLRERSTMSGGQQGDRGREEGEAPGGGVEGLHIIRGKDRAVQVGGESQRRVRRFTMTTMTTRTTRRTSARTPAGVLRRCYLAR